MTGTTYTFIMPAWYVTKSEDDLIRDCTETVRSLLKNEVWKRGFDYGFSGALMGIKPEEVIRVHVTITSLTEFHCGKPLMDIAEKLVPRFPRSDAHNNVDIGWRQNYLVTTIELARTFRDNDESKRSMEYVTAFHEAMAINKEVSALIKAAIQLVYHCVYMPLNSSQGRWGVGLAFIHSASKIHTEEIRDYTHTYPAILEPESRNSFEHVFQLLAERWYFSLWPIHRFLKAIPGEFAEVEGILDLLFALEGLFEKNASSDLIRLTSAILCSRHLSNARQVDDLLKRAFSIRNEIVHGGKSYTGLEKQNTSKGEKIVWEIFWDLKTVVAGMIRLSLEKLVVNPEMRNLRFLADDVLTRVFSRE